jgi:hypothetical protein
MESTNPTDQPGPASPADLQGSAFALFALDIAFQINLEQARALLRDAALYQTVRGRRPSPKWFDYSPPPVRLLLDIEPIDLGGATIEPLLEVLLYDFGAVLFTYRLPLPGDIEQFPALGVLLYDNEQLIADATRRTEALMQTIGPALERPRLRDVVEDFAIYAVTNWPADESPQTLLERHGHTIARTVQAESGPLCDALTAQTIEGRLSYGPNDLVIIDWNAAFLIDPKPEDVLAVLQFANVELLEMRVLDQELDAILDHADETIARVTRRKLWPAYREQRALKRFASAQTDAVVMFEGVNNAIKLLGNQYLAQLYRLIARRLDVPAWQASVQRKLAAADNIYQKMSDVSSIRRLETLEWVIIVLIALSMLLPLLPFYSY